MNGCEICGNSQVANEMCNKCKYSCFVSVLDDNLTKSPIVTNNTLFITSDGVIYDRSNKVQSHGMLIGKYSAKFGYMNSDGYMFGVDDVIGYFIDRFNLIYVSSQQVKSVTFVKMRQLTTQLRNIFKELIKCSSCIEAECVDDDGSYVVVNSVVDLNKFDLLKYEEPQFNSVKRYRDEEREGDKFDPIKWALFN